LSGADLAQIAGFFGGVSAADLEEFAARAELVSFEEGELVYQQGDPAHDGLLLLEGLLEVSIEASRQVRHVGLVRPGELVGEFGLFVSQAARNATVQANKASRGLRIEPGLLSELPENPAVAVLELHLLSALGRRMRNMNQLITLAWRDEPPKHPTIKSSRSGLLGRLGAMFGRSDAQ
jgi:CRP-like cAMP-binding protein